LATRYHGQFFDKATTQSQVKLRVYSTYLRPWAAKLGSNPLNRRLWIVDGFAGRGRYKDGTAGSPELAMQLARDAALEGRRYKVQCIFGETREANQGVLRSLRGQYPDASSLLIEDDFWNRIEDVIGLVSGEPSLVFIDPFGLAGLRFERLVTLVNGLGKVDLIVNLRTPAAVRLAPKMSERISRAVGTSDWTLETVSEIFRRNLSRACNFLPPAPLMINDRLAGRLHTELVLASRAPDAYLLWNDEIVKEVERLGAETALGDSAASRDQSIDLVTDRLREWTTRQRTWRRSDAIDFYVVNYCGDAHSGTIKRAHERLLTLGVECLNPREPVEARRYAKVAAGT